MSTVTFAWEDTVTRVKQNVKKVAKSAVNNATNSIGGEHKEVSGAFRTGLRWASCILICFALTGNVIANILQDTSVVTLPNQATDPTVYPTVMNNVVWVIIPLWAIGLIGIALDLTATISHMADPGKSTSDFVNGSVVANWGILVFTALVFDLLGSIGLSMEWNKWVCWSFALTAWVAESIVDDRNWLWYTIVNMISCGDSTKIANNKRTYETIMDRLTIKNPNVWLAQLVPYSIWNVYLNFNVWRYLIIAIMYNGMTHVGTLSLEDFYVTMICIFVGFIGLAFKGLLGRSSVWCFAASYMFIGLFASQYHAGLQHAWITSIVWFIVFFFAGLIFGWVWLSKRSESPRSDKVEPVFA